MNEHEKRIAAEARNAYARKWRAANKDKVRANNANYWLRKAKKATEPRANNRNGKENANA